MCKYVHIKKSDRIYKTTSHDFRIKELQRLKENGHFSKGSNVCAGCHAYARTHLKPKLQKKKENNDPVQKRMAFVHSFASSFQNIIFCEILEKKLHVTNTLNFYLQKKLGLLGNYVAM